MSNNLILVLVLTPLVFCALAHKICTVFWPHEAEEEESKQKSSSRAASKMADEQAARPATAGKAAADTAQENPVVRERRRKELEDDAPEAGDFEVPEGFSFAEVRDSSPAQA